MACRLDDARRLLLAPRSPAVRIGLMLAAVAIAAGLRWMLDRGAYGVPFLTFYPVVLLAALFLGSRYAVLSALLSLLVVRLLFVHTGWYLADLSIRLLMLAMFGVTVAIIVGTGHFVRQILIENQAHIAQAEAFNAELQHRAKNALQVLRALVGRGPREGEDPHEFHAKLLGRMKALGKANQLLRFGALDSARWADLLAGAIAPFDPSRFRCTGPDCRVHNSAATPLVMALHELGTNAVKYGALSVESGHVEVEWSVVDGGRLAVVWREVGGPPVTPPATRGFGSRLLRPHGGLKAVTLDWAPAGLVCRMELLGRPAAT